MKRLLDAWLPTGMRLGRFLDNSVMLAGGTLRRMTEDELADAAEKYVAWREKVFKGQFDKAEDTNASG